MSRPTKAGVELAFYVLVLVSLFIFLGLRDGWGHTVLYFVILAVVIAIFQGVVALVRRLGR